MESISEGATSAIDNQDHLWHGKAMESLLLCMVLLSWSNMAYTVPQICRSLPNRSGLFGSSVTSTAEGSLKTLAQLIPPLTETILELYAKVSNLDLGGSLQDLLREARVRHVNLLVLIKSAGSVMNKHTLDRIVLGVGPESSTPELVGEHIVVSKAGLANILLEALHTSQASNNSSHCTSVLVAVSASLSLLGLGRKSAFYMKQLMQNLAPKLIEARKVGASEVGVHPSAGLPPLGSALQGILPEMVSGSRTMLSLAAGAYGVPLSEIPQTHGRVSASSEGVHERLTTWAAEHSSGDALLKVEMLRTCVVVAEALPDIPAELHLVSNILRLAKQTITMPTLSRPKVPLISTEEQNRLMDSMKRAVSAATRLGTDGCKALYWDDFLVRNVQVYEQDSFAKLISHAPKDLSIRSNGVTDTVRDPFIYNPFGKNKSTASAPVLVAGETATFAVVLQNPLEVEIEIDEICLTTEGATFLPSMHSVVLGPLSLQTFSLNGTPTDSGHLEITGCRATIRNCYQQDFLVFHEEWKMPSDLKQKAGGKGRVTKRQSQDEDISSVSVKPPIASRLKLKVIDAQPRLAVKSTTLDHSSIMLLEGESRNFILNLTNESTDVAADLVVTTTDDSVTARLQDTLLNKDLLPAEVYEIQHQLAYRPSISIKEHPNPVVKRVLQPGHNADYTVSIDGRPGLVSATIQADYAYLGSSSSQVKGTFYTRQVRMPIAVTVNGSVDIPRCNVTPVHSDFGWKANTENQRDSQNTDTSKLASYLNHREDVTDYCMLSLDMRNVWPRPLSIEIKAKRSQDTESWDGAYAVHETLQPGQVTRVVLLVPRLFIRDPYAPIPNLDMQKQFVVSKSNLSMEAETASRESFWYREKLLECLCGTWTEDSTGRHGEIDLRKGIRLGPRMVDVLKMDHVDISYTIVPNDATSNKPSTDRGEMVEQVGKSHFIVRTESFATLKVHVHNRTQDTLRLILRLQPTLRHQPHNIALDLAKLFAWTGVLQRALHPSIPPDGTCEAELGIIALVQGKYDISASVEEIKGRRKNTATKLADAGGHGGERRIWHARTPCMIDAA
jgi:hypothetical protein